MRLGRLLVAAAVATAFVVAVPAPAAAAPPDAGVVVVPGDGMTVRTLFATRPGYTYRVTVTGAYSYNGRQNLADCGWWNPETAGDAWFPGGFLLLDGATARCGSQPYTTTHTYTWLQDGTGAPFTFRVADAGNPYDNVGVLEVAVEEDRAPRSVRISCYAGVASDSEFDLVAVDVVARVTTAGGYGTTYQSGQCRVVGPRGTMATVPVRGAGPEAVAADVVLVPEAAYQVCGTADAYWLTEGGYEYAPEQCVPVITAGG